MSYEPHEICHCNCHAMEGVYHVMACCHQCPHCGANIARGFEVEHGKRCEQEHLDAGLPVNQYVMGVLNGDTFNGLPFRLPFSSPAFKGMSERVADDLDREILKDLEEMIRKGTTKRQEESPAVKFLRECQERERKLGK